jgi:hypothetical protein
MIIFESFLTFKLQILRYNVFHRFRQAKFVYGGLILGSSQFLLLTRVPLKTTRKMVNIDSIKLIKLPRSKSVKQTVGGAILKIGLKMNLYTQI